MKQMIFAVKDNKANLFLRPMVCDAKAIAVRSFAMLVTDTETACGNFPEEFDLYTIGFYDLKTGIIETVLPELVCNGAIVAAAERQRKIALLGKENKEHENS